MSKQNPPARRVLVAALATLALTAAHHLYGGLVYGTPWRTHGAAVALALGVPIGLAYLAQRRHPGTKAGVTAGWIFAGMSLVFPLLIVGGFEGLYNHVAKNVLFFAGAPHGLLVSLFPPPTYELPNDALFEISGMLQVVPAAFIARALFDFRPRPAAA